MEGTFSDIETHEALRHELANSAGCLEDVRGRRVSY